MPGLWQQELKQPGLPWGFQQSGNGFRTTPKGSSSLLEDFFQSDTRVSRGFRGLLVWDRVRVMAPWEVIGSSPRLLPVSVVFSVARNSPDHQEDRGQKLSSLKRKWRHASLKTG